MRAYVYAQCADTSTKTFMLHIAVSRIVIPMSEALSFAESRRQ
jgi:hypothetical protein